MNTIYKTSNGIMVTTTETPYYLGNGTFRALCKDEKNNTYLIRWTFNQYTHTGEISLDMIANIKPHLLAINLHGTGKTYIQDFLEKFPLTLENWDGGRPCKDAIYNTKSRCVGHCEWCWNELIGNENSCEEQDKIGEKIDELYE